MLIFRDCKKYRSFAIITVLALIALLSVISFNFAFKSKLNLKTAINESESKKAYYYAYAGYNMAITIIMNDKNGYDGPGDIWYSEIPPIPFDNGRIIIRIEDEKSRFNIKKLVNPYGYRDNRRVAMLRRIFKLLNIDEYLIGAIVDWEDKDDVVSPGGAESSYYINSNPPYRPFDKPFITTGELLLVKGFKGDYYFLPPSSRNGEKSFKALSKYITVYGNGLININTAEVPVLCSLSEDITEEIANDIISYREKNPFKKIEDLKNVETVSDILYDEISSLITVKSNLFRIKAIGVIGELKETIEAVVMRQSRGGRVVFFNRSL